MPKRKKRNVNNIFTRFYKWGQSIPKRMKEIITGSISIFFAIFFIFIIFNIAGDFGEWTRSELFINSEEGKHGFFGWSFIALTIFLFYIGYILITNKKRLSTMRLWSGFLFGTISLAAFFSVSFTNTAGGTLGNFFFKYLENFFGTFSYIIIPVVLFLSLVVIGIISPISIWNWLYLKDTDEENKGKDEYERDENKNNGRDKKDEECKGEYEYEEDEEDENEEECEEYEEDENEEGCEEYEEDENEEEYEKEKQITNSFQQKYLAPPLSLLNTEKGRGRAENTKAQTNTIKRTLKNFKVDVEIEEVVVGPTFTRYSVRPAEGIKLSKITSLQQNLELALASHPIRVEAPIPGQSLVGIEVPNSSRAIVGLKTLLESKEFKEVKGGLPLVIGKNITGKVFTKSLSKMPHILVAGTTGSGKSVLIHNLILSLLFYYGPKELRLIFIDPKRVELTLYKGISHLLTNPITDPKEALKSLVWTASEMERRYQLLEDIGARDITSYNKQIKDEQDYIPYIVVVIDELADLMQNFPREIEANIVRIAQKSRAVGIHLILSTQRPSVNIITGTVKANIPVRVGLQVASNIDSRTILDTSGAETLVGNGDLLFSSSETKKPVRAQSAFVTEEEVKKVVDFIIRKNGVAEGLIDINKKQQSNISSGIIGDEEDDDLLPEAMQIVIDSKKASTSLLQRKLKVGYSRAARLIDMLEEKNIVGPQNGSKPREILIEKENNEENN